jgi:hypothetical protein
MDNLSENNILNKNLKSFESNKLINPDIIEDEIEDEEEDDGETSEMDDETLEIINRVRLKKSNNKDNNFFKVENSNPEEPINKVIKKIKEKKSMSLQEFSKIANIESKPEIKKFSSNRVENKKKLYDNTSIVKREFNPRKPPYNFIRKSYIINSPQINDIKDFPNLK